MQVRVGSAEAMMLISPHCLWQGVQQQAEGQSSGSLEDSLHSKEAESVGVEALPIKSSTERIGFWLQPCLSLIMQAGTLYPTKDQSDLYKFMSPVGS